MSQTIIAPQTHAELLELFEQIPLLEQDLPDGYQHKREYESNSSLETFSQCPLAYKRRYIDKHFMNVPKSLIVDPLAPTTLGSLVHRGLELATMELWQRGHKGFVHKHGALYQDKLSVAFVEMEEAQGVLLPEAQEMVQAWLPTESVYADQIRGLEWPFTLVLEDPDGDVILKGFIDRLEILHDGTIKIKDYKTSRLLFTKDELRRNMQATIYEMAVRDSTALHVDEEQPVDEEFIMLRHGITQRTRRTPEQMNLAFTTIVAMVRKINSLRTFRPSLNKYCAYRECRFACPLWREIVKQGLPEGMVDVNNIQQIGMEYERMNNAAKILYRRKEEMADLMKIHLIGHECIETPDHVYRLSKSMETKFLDPHATASILAKAFNATVPKVIGRIGRISKTEYDAVVGMLSERMSIHDRHEVEKALNQLITTEANPKLQTYAHPKEKGKAGVTRKRRQPRKAKRST